MCKSKASKSLLCLNGTGNKVTVRVCTWIVISAECCQTWKRNIDSNEFFSLELPQRCKFPEEFSLATSESFNLKMGQNNFFSLYSDLSCFNFCECENANNSSSYNFPPLWYFPIYNVAMRFFESHSTWEFSYCKNKIGE